MPVKDGRYTLQMWAGGKLGENQDILVDRRKTTVVKTSLSDDGVFPERTVQGIPAVLPLGDRDDLVFLHKKGITRVDGRTGKDLWTTDATEFLKAANTLSQAERENQRNKESKERESVRPIKWLSKQYLSNYHDRLLPVVVQDFPDINQDGEREVLIASHEHPALFAFDGKTGDLRWHYVAAPTIPEDKQVFQHNKAGALRRPCDIGDVDGDGVHDFATTFYSKDRRVYQWIDAVSGKTGQRIWRLELPQKWFDTGNHILSEFSAIDPTFGSHHRYINSNGRFRDGMSFRGSRGTRVAIPWPLTLIRAESDSEVNSLLLVCGSKLFVRDPKTGEATDFNQGEPLDLGFVPALPPRLVRSGDEEESPIGVLLCEQVSIADPNTAAKPPVTRFSMWSLETAKELWRFDTASDPGWIGVMPDWPLVADLTGDCVPEILVADGADLERSVYLNASGLASLQALDARTGKPVWDDNDIAQIRTQDRQVQHMLLGPDADGDQRDDVYVVSPMSTQKNKVLIYVDILSGETGKLIRSTKSNAPIVDIRREGVDLETPFFLGVGADGYPRLVVATTEQSRRFTLLLSTGTGEVTHVGDRLEYPLQADGDGDGDLDLFLIKPRGRDRVTEAAQLVSLKSYSGRERKLAGGGFLPTDDVDGDGVGDLVTDPQRGNLWQALSGATGERLWLWGHQQREGSSGSITPLNKDVDGDNINDYLATGTSTISNPYGLSLTLVSGHGGRALWQTDLTTNYGYGGSVGVKCEDMNADGVNDVLLIHRFCKSPNMTGSVNLRLSCLDGRSGAEHWRCQLAAAGAMVFRAILGSEKIPVANCRR